MSEGTDGPAKYRLQRRISSDKTLNVWVQVRRWFKWHDHYHVENEHRKAMIEVLESFDKLREALEMVELTKDDLKKADKQITTDASTRRAKMFFAPGGDTSEMWTGPTSKAEQELPDRSEEYKSLVKRWSLDKLLKEGSIKPEPDRPFVTGYYLEGDPPPDKEWKDNEHINLTHSWRTNRQQQNKGKGSHSQNNRS